MLIFSLLSPILDDPYLTVTSVLRDFISPLRDSFSSKICFLKRRVNQSGESAGLTDNHKNATSIASSPPHRYMVSLRHDLHSAISLCYFLLVSSARRILSLISSIVITELLRLFIIFVELAELSLGLSSGSDTLALFSKMSLNSVTLFHVIDTRWIKLLTYTKCKKKSFKVYRVYEKRSTNPWYCIHQVVHHYQTIYFVLGRDLARLKHRVFMQSNDIKTKGLRDIRT